MSQKTEEHTSSRFLLARGLSLSWLFRLVTYVRWCFPQCTSRVSCRNNLKGWLLVQTYKNLLHSLSSGTTCNMDTRQGRLPSKFSAQEHPAHMKYHQMKKTFLSIAQAHTIGTSA